MTREAQADPDAVDGLLSVSQPIVAVAMKPLGAAAEEITVVQYRALVILAARRPQRLADVAAAPGLAPSASVPRPRPPVRHRGPVRPGPPVLARAQERS